MHRASINEDVTRNCDSVSVSSHNDTSKEFITKSFSGCKHNNSMFNVEMLVFVLTFAM